MQHSQPLDKLDTFSEKQINLHKKNRRKLNLVPHMSHVQQFILQKTKIEKNPEIIGTFIKCKLPFHTHTYLKYGLLKHYQNSIGIYFLQNAS